MRVGMAACVVVALLASAVLGVAPAGAGTPGKRCGHIARVGEAATEIASVRAAGVHCAVARRVLERHTVGRTTRGWECHSAGTEGSCTRGGRTASYRAAKSRGCGSIAFQRNTENGAGSIRARGVRCRAARAVARASKPYGPTHARTYRARGFTCRGRTLGSELPTAIYTCRKGRAVVAFQRS